MRARENGMRLRQKLFAAILAAMMLMFLLLSLSSLLNALEAQQARQDLEERLESVAREYFLSAIDLGEPDFDELSGQLELLGAGEWEVVSGGKPLLGASSTSF